MNEKQVELLLAQLKQLNELLEALLWQMQQDAKRK